MVEAVRARPGMYIGRTDDIHPLLWELLGNAIDESLNGHARTIEVWTDGERVTIEDDGRGIPFDLIARVFTTLHGGIRAPRTHRHVSAQLHGAGCAVTTALARELVVTVWRDGHRAEQRFERGIACGPITLLGATTRTGTRITCEPDFTILQRMPWDAARIAERCHDLAGIEPGLHITVNGETFCYARTSEYARENRTVIVEPCDVDVLENGVGVRAAIAWHDGPFELRSFVNGSPAKGDHVEAFERAIGAVFARKLRRKVSRTRIQRGMIAVLHVMLDDPRWGAPTKEWLQNSEVAVTVRTVIERAFAQHLERTPALLDALLLRWQTT